MQHTVVVQKFTTHPKSKDGMTKRPELTNLKFLSRKKHLESTMNTWGGVDWPANQGPVAHAGHSNTRYIALTTSQRTVHNRLTLFLVR